MASQHNLESTSKTTPSTSTNETTTAHCSLSMHTCPSDEARTCTHGRASSILAQQCRSTLAAGCVLLHCGRRGLSRDLGCTPIHTPLSSRQISPTTFPSCIVSAIAAVNRSLSEGVESRRRRAEAPQSPSRTHSEGPPRADWRSQLAALRQRRNDAARCRACAYAHLPGPMDVQMGTSMHEHSAWMHGGVVWDGVCCVARG